MFERSFTQFSIALFIMQTLLPVSRTDEKESLYMEAFPLVAAAEAAAAAAAAAALSKSKFREGPLERNDVIKTTKENMFCGAPVSSQLLVVEEKNCRRGAKHHNAHLVLPI